jgi:hypothetical protein
MDKNFFSKQYNFESESSSDVFEIPLGRFKLLKFACQDLNASGDEFTFTFYMDPLMYVNTFLKYEDADLPFVSEEEVFISSSKGTPLQLQIETTSDINVSIRIEGILLGD